MSLEQAVKDFLDTDDVSDVAIQEIEIDKAVAEQFPERVRALYMLNVIEHTDVLSLVWYDGEETNRLLFDVRDGIEQEQIVEEFKNAYFGE